MSATTTTYDKIEAAEYLRLVDEERTPVEAKVIRQLIDWARNAGLRDNFNQGARGSAFIPVLEHNGKRFYPVSVQAKGLVVIQLRWLKDHEPFTGNFPVRIRQDLSRFFAMHHFPIGKRLHSGDAGRYFHLWSVLDAARFKPKFG